MPAPTAVGGGQELDRDLAGDIDTSAADRNGFVGNSSIQAQCVAKLVVQRHGRKTETEHRNRHQQQPQSVIAFRAVHLSSEEHTSELQSLMRISYAVFCLTKNNQILQNR